MTSSIEKAVEKVGRRRQEDIEEPSNTVKVAAESSAPASRAVPAGGGAHNTGETTSDYGPGRTAGPSQTPARVGMLDLEKARSVGMPTPDDTDHPLAEEFRRIKRPLLNNAFGLSSTLVENGNLILVTSSIPGEGKTYVSLCLAMSIALEYDKTVLLVDADIAKETASLFFGEQMDVGLLDAIIEPQLQLDEIIVETNIPRLSLLPAGRLRERPAELLASDKMRGIVRQLGAHADRIVVFDSPPLLATSEASVLATMVGQIVMVVEAEKTTQKMVTQAMSLLDRNQPICMLLNKSRTRLSGGYYYGYYGYGR